MKFELDKLPRNCSKKEIIDELIRINAIIDENSFSISYLKKYGKVSIDIVRSRFGSWGKALIEAGLESKFSGKKKPLKNTFNITNDEIISELKRISGSINKNQLTHDDINENSKIISSSTVRNRFGTLENGLEMSKINITSSGKRYSYKLTDSEIVEELISLSKKLGKNYLTNEDVDDNSQKISSSTVRNRFGSWEKGLKKAGLQITPSGKRYTEEELLENLLNVWTFYGRPPKYSEMTLPPSNIKAKTYEFRWNKWSNALKEFVSRMNQDIDLVEEKINLRKDTFIDKKKYELKIKNDDGRKKAQKKVSEKDNRTIKLSLRYKVLNRDNFKCVKCGASPATEINCKLQVDHIIPFSKGGKTTIDNLQTLCKHCNLGKGNKYNE